MEAKRIKRQVPAKIVRHIVTELCDTNNAIDAAVELKVPVSEFIQTIRACCFNVA